MSQRIPIFLLALFSASALAFAPQVSAQEDDYDDEYDDYDDEYDDEYDEDEEEYDEEEYGEDEEYESDEEYEDDEGYEDEEYEDEEEESDEGGDEEAPLVHSSLHGETGLFHVVSADSGEMLTFAVGLHMNFFLMSDWLYGPGVVPGIDVGDDNSYIGGTAHIRFTVWDYIEAYFSVTNYANANTHEEPQLFQTLGDMVLGLKGFYPVLDWLFIGGGFGVYFLNQVGDVAFAGSSTSAALRFAMTFDVLRATGRIPIRFHINWEYFFDNSANLVAGVERRRAGFDAGDESVNGCAYDISGDGLPDDDAGCITRVERTALHISRLDTTWIRLGVEFPTRYVVPFVEYNVGIPVNRQDFNCVYREPEEPVVGTEEGIHDTCYDIARGSAMPMWLTLGLRVLPWVRGLALNLGVDIGLTGTRTFVQELPATPPYMVYLGLSYSYNPRRRVVEQVREVEIEVETEAEDLPVIAGRVIDAENQQAVASALVTFPGRDLTTLATGTDGSFISWPLQAGEVTVHVEHPDYNAADCTATLPEHGQTAMECSLTPLPRRGTMGGQVTEEEAGPISAATVTIEGQGAAPITVTTDTDGRFERELEAGSYTVRVEAEGFMRRGARTVEIRSRQETDVDLQLRRQPTRALVQIRGNQIRILRPVHFRHNSAEIDPDSHVLLEQVADVIHRNPDQCRIEIQGHTDSSGTRQRNMTLSQERSESVMNYLTNMGVSSDRVAARGYGPDRPVAPNITAAGRSRNRRVEFHITERCEAQ